MPQVSIEQALFTRESQSSPQLVSRSPGFREEWLPIARSLVLGFGERPPGVACPHAVFACPLNRESVAVVQVADLPNHSLQEPLGFHFLVVDRRDYEHLFGDPFVLAKQLPATWDLSEEVPTLLMPREPQPQRTITDVQAVLKRVKASALRDDEDPEAPDFQRTIVNSESPALLGGVQVLVDGGRLVFERPAGDLDLVTGLWLLLPYSIRAKAWPASFAFNDAIRFDVIVVPSFSLVDLTGSTTEDQAADYPQGSYELALQRAAESGTQQDLEGVFARRSSNEVLRFAIGLVAVLAVMMIVAQWLGSWEESERTQRSKVAAAAGMVAVGDPWTVLGIKQFGDHLWMPQQEKAGD